MPTAGELEIFRHSLRGIVEEMGVTLERTAYSTNIKIRRDHTCAIFDADLRHVAQHDVAPQHIGTLITMVPETVKERGDELRPGDGILINDPYRGEGSIHLPDVAVISPLFHEGEVIGYAANSAHHVDIGGSTPGGISNDSTELIAEGIVLPGIKAIEEWEFDDDVLDLITRNVRGANMRLGDYRAQLAANRVCQDRYAALLAEHGGDGLRERLDALTEYTERRVRSALAELPDGTYHADDTLDGDGVVDEPVELCLTVDVDDDEMTIDFTGTAAENAGPLNCTPALAFAGVIYAVMALLDEDGAIPKNDGFYRPFETITPDGTMVNPSPNTPVAGGAEVAVRAADLVIKALAEAVPDRAIAAGKGTICNIAYGGPDPRDGGRYVYYETVAGGYGARAEKDGMEAVQAHFQNTANSPIEELETEIPVYVRRYELIPNSGGAGRTRGGLGVRRDLEFYDHEASFSVLADRARNRPWGLFGGDPGRSAEYGVYATGKDSERRAASKSATGRDEQYERGEPQKRSFEEVSSKTTVTLEAGDVFSVRTPGGGGYGDPHERDPDAVREDVRNGKVSPAAGREVYGVDLEPERETATTTEERSANAGDDDEGQA